MVGDTESSNNKRGKRAAVSLTATAFAVLTMVALLPAWPLPTHAASTNPIPICPGPIMEGESDRVGMDWSGSYPLTPVVFHTTADNHTADYSDFTPFHPVTVGGGGVTEPLWVTVHATQDSRPEHDETFEIGIATHGGFISCVITIIDDDAPAVTRVDITSDPARGDTYRSGEHIDVRLTFDKAVDVVDDASINLQFGDGDQYTTREAGYLRGSGTRRLYFRYQVQPSDWDSDGIAVSGAGPSDEDGPIDGISGVVYARGTDIPINYTHPGAEGASSHKVDGRPRVMSVGVISTPPDGWEAYRADQTIEIALNFDIDVAVEGEVRLALYVGLVRDNWTEAWREAGYLKGSGTGTLVFGYNVERGDTDIRGIAIPNGATAVVGTGAIKASTADVEYLEHFPATGHLPDHKIDTAPPTISGVYMTSRPADGEAYGVGEVISVEVVFTEPVAKAGNLQVELDVGGTTRYASLRPEANPSRRFNNDMVFEYQVQAGDADSDGIGINTDSLRLNGGSIDDRAGNGAVLSHDPVASDARHLVDTSPEE